MIGIVGAGLGGFFSAWSLTERNIPCAVVGKKENAASFAAQGVVGNKGLFLADTPLFANKIRGAKAIAEFCRKISNQSQEKLIIEASVFEPFASVEAWRKSQRRVYRQDFYGCYGARLLTPSEIAISPMFSAFEKHPMVAMQYSFDAFVDVELLLKVMREILQKRGVKFFDEEIARVEHNGKWSLQSKHSPILRCDHLFLAPGSSVDFFRRELELDIPASQLASGYTFSCRTDETQREAFSLLRETHAYCQFSNLISLGSSSHKGSLNAADQQQDLEELKKTFAYEIDFSGLRLDAKGGERVFYKNREPICGTVTSKRFAQPVYLLSGLYKNGLQLAPLLGEKLCKEFLARPS